MNYQNKVILQSELSIKHAFIMRKKNRKKESTYRDFSFTTWWVDKALGLVQNRVVAKKISDGVDVITASLSRSGINKSTIFHSPSLTLMPLGETINDAHTMAEMANLIPALPPPSFFIPLPPEDSRT